jgi:flagellar hook-basal body complex protein FliE
MSNNGQGTTKTANRPQPASGAAASAQAVATEAPTHVEQLQQGAAADPTTVLKQQAEQYLQEVVLPMERAKWEKVGGLQEFPLLHGSLRPLPCLTWIALR